MIHAAARVNRAATKVLFAADRQTLPPLGATALQDEAAVLRGHANKKSMRLSPTARIRLVRALTLHDLSGSPLGSSVGVQLIGSTIALCSCL